RCLRTQLGILNGLENLSLNLEDRIGALCFYQQRFVQSGRGGIAGVGGVRTPQNLLEFTRSEPSRDTGGTQERSRPLVTRLGGVRHAQQLTDSLLPLFFAELQIL